MLAILGFAWLAFCVVHSVASGRFSLWVIPGLAPPLVFAVVPLVLVVAGLFARGRRVIVVVAAVLATVVAGPYSGINPAAVDGPGRATASGPQVHVVTLNTDYWAQNRDGVWSARRDRGALFSYLRSLDADVYLLQEHMLRIDNAPRPITDLTDVRVAFPEYQAVIAGTLLTLSRLPVVGQDVVHSPDEPTLQFPAPYGLRVDIQSGDRTLSTYNVHMPVQLLLEESPFALNFYREIQARHERRSAEYQALTAAVRENPLPLLVAGDFNTSQAMGDNRELLRATTDAAAASGYIYPTSWRVGGNVPKLWRNDWALLSGPVEVDDYRFLDPQGNSDHMAQDLRLVISGREEVRS